jgi:hypothetical protein
MINSSSSHTMHAVLPQIHLTRPGINSSVEAILFIADVAEWTYDSAAGTAVYTILSREDKHLSLKNLDLTQLGFIFRYILYI